MARTTQVSAAGAKVARNPNNACITGENIFEAQKQPSNNPI
jgi:hypothetical protein